VAGPQVQLPLLSLLPLLVGMKLLVLALARVL
jgi:hypothetical protein